MSKNLHQQYYKKYFNGIDFSYLQNDGVAPDWVKNEIKKRNAALCERNLLEKISRIEYISEGQSFELEVLYPGLITGIGINHEAKIEGEFKLGVHFDWTHGMPIVYGSSVKGVLRSWFTEFYKGNIDPIDLMMDIFEGVYDRDVKAEQEKYKEDWAEKVEKANNRIYKSRRNIYERDVFFDAVLVKADKKGRILCSDSITPHGNNPLENPTPITFLKIAPGCKLEFRFKLHDSDFGGDNIITATQKMNLFEEILKTVGIGAKTNVGYGQLSKSKNK